LNRSKAVDKALLKSSVSRVLFLFLLLRIISSIKNNWDQQPFLHNQGQEEKFLLFLLLFYYVTAHEMVEIRPNCDIMH